jgi:TonB family protein
MVLLSLGYSWFLNSAGDVKVYLYSSSGPYLKSTQGSLLDPEELNAFLKNPAPPAVQKNNQQNSKDKDALHDFVITENTATRDIKPLPEEIDIPSDVGIDTESSSDSSVFGGFLLGNGEGGASGSNLDRFPVFPGGTEGVRRYLELNVKYPLQAIKQKINGVVLVSFRVNKLGDVDNIKVERSINPLIDEEAIKALQGMPRWKPGLRHGRPINVTFVIPVNFVPVS